MFFRCFFQLFKKLLNTIFWWCIVLFFYSVDVVFLISDLKYQKVDKGVAISGSLATPTETIVFWVLKFNAIGMFRSLWCRLRPRIVQLVHFFQSLFFLNHWFFQIKSAHYCLFSTGCWRFDGDERTLFWLNCWFFVIFFSQIRTRPPRLGRSGWNFQSFLRYFWLD
jgi:hypothetical protein